MSIPKTIECLDPATRECLGEIPVNSPAEVRESVARAKLAQQAWKQTSFEERRRVLGELLAYIVENKFELAELVQRDSGKTRENALIGEIWTTCEKFKWTIKNGEKHLRPEPVSSGLLMHKKARLEFHPLGVVGVIISWNYPFQNFVNAIPPALMAGNAIVIKPSEWVAWSSSRFVEGFQDVLKEAGHSRDLIQVVQGYGETGNALVRAEIDTMLFIGSVTNGRKVIEASAEQVIPVVMELGGKDAFIVCDDASVEQAVHAALSGCYINCGQNCVASERILVHEKVYEAFENRAAELVGAFRQGSSRDGVVDVGAMITPLQLNVVDELVQSAVAEGARVVVGGKRTLEGTGDFFEPTILADVTPKMRIMNEEVFGPVMLLCKVRDDAHAIEIANSIEYGLGSSVFSKNRARARAIVSQLDAGMSAINDFSGMTYMVQDLTFGGVKASGFGRMNGRDGLRSMCNVKAVLDDRFSQNAPAKIFPVAEENYEKMGGVIDLIYGQGVGSRWKGLQKILGQKS